VIEHGASIRPVQQIGEVTGAVEAVQFGGKPAYHR
jgi:hypothetical protein